ncbi:MAG: ABC transporter substrate-binding protein [Vicinamibacterales bacterium]
MATGKKIVTTENTKVTEAFFLALFFFVSSVGYVVNVDAQQPKRIVSLVPNVTEILYAIGAGSQVVAVSSYDEEPPAVRRLPKVGALMDPDTERIITLRPDLVITYSSQVDLQSQLTRASIPFFDYRHGDLAHIMATMRGLGERTGHSAEAEQAARALEARIDEVRARVKGKPRPRTLLVFERDSGTLRNIYASAGRGFLHDMLEVAGGVDVLDEIDKESAQASIENILTLAPEVILELRSADRLSDAAMQTEVASWSSLASVPAVKNHRVMVLVGKELTVPGPRVAEAIERMAKALHP